MISESVVTDLDLFEVIWLLVSFFDRMISWHWPLLRRLAFSLGCDKLLGQKKDGEGTGWITDSHISVLCGTRVHVARCLQVRFTGCEKGSSLNLQVAWPEVRGSAEFGPEFRARVWRSSGNVCSGLHCVV